MHILVFEDEPQLRLRVSQLLEEEGYNVMSFALPSRAFEAIGSSEIFPKIAILDIQIGNLSTYMIEQEQIKGFPQETAGIELAKKILQIKNIPIIFLTAHGDMYKSAEQVGAYVFFEKGKIDLLSVVTNVNQIMYTHYRNNPD